jgi:hypothetical protein
MPDSATIDAVLQVRRGQERTRRADDNAQLDAGKQRFPQRDFVAEHHQ